MIHEISAVEARQNFGELLNEVKYKNDSILIKKAGKPIAALITVELFQKTRKLRAQFDKLFCELAHTYSEQDEKLAQQEIDEALRSS